MMKVYACEFSFASANRASMRNLRD